MSTQVDDGPIESGDYVQSDAGFCGMVKDVNYEGPNIVLWVDKRGVELVTHRDNLTIIAKAPTTRRRAK